APFDRERDLAKGVNAPGRALVRAGHPPELNRPVSFGHGEGHGANSFGTCAVCRSAGELRSGEVDHDQLLPTGRDRGHMKRPGALRPHEDEPTVHRREARYPAAGPGHLDATDRGRRQAVEGAELVRWAGLTVAMDGPVR